MKQQHYVKIVMIGLLVFVGLVHLLRLFMQWELKLNNWMIPLWVSGVVAVFLFALVYLIMKYY